MPRKKRARTSAPAHRKPKRTKRARLEGEVTDLANARAVSGTAAGSAGRWASHYTRAYNMVTGTAYSDKSSVQLARKLNDSFLIERHGKAQCPLLFAGFQQVKSLGGHVRKGALAFKLGTFIPSPDPDKYGYNRTLTVFHYHQCVFPSNSPVHRLYRAACLSNMPFTDLSLKALCLRAIALQLIAYRHEDGPAGERAMNLEATLQQVHCKLPWPYYQNHAAEQVLAHYELQLKWSQDPAAVKCGWDAKTQTLRLPERQLFATPDAFYATVFLLLGKYLTRELPKERELGAAIWCWKVCAQLGIDDTKRWTSGACRAPFTWTPEDEARVISELDIPEIVTNAE